MEIYKYEEIRAVDYWKYRPEIVRLKSELKTALERKYMGKRFQVPISNQITKLVYVANGDLSKKRLLDLGCGNNDNIDNYGLSKTSLFEPWLCRGLYELGFNPIGIDYGNLDREKFEHHQIDLVNERLDCIPDSSIDIVNASELFNSPFLKIELGDRTGVGLMKILLPQIERVVKPLGCFIYSTD
jgi:hypothetical protein